MLTFKTNNVLQRSLGFEDERGNYLSVPYSYFEKRAGHGPQPDFRYLYRTKS